ncbi:iron-sulfur cluster biosynthesis family protein [Halalkalibacter sp. APA_J-10(15)]|uniref:iron-sulfur cluster biosynthesis family protein n=1 Tax=unclassified Halalkalibacter TaxID=2893063 RepID=UPI001FF32268|nr:iron-sulfur cluster biosynthesis family protein [Halalkalibacter sp. APA_J-10(15)]MCK0471913.1 iron-sulfur cluster biosynthesis family protein [Halalkalibacter sp. APA_J-10(15)]
MDIQVTPSAVDFFKQTSLEGKKIRVRAYDTFECSTMVAYDIVLDKKSEDDLEVSLKGLPFIYNTKAIDEIGNYIKVDYVPSQGLKMVNTNQTLAYGLSLKSV